MFAVAIKTLVYEYLCVIFFCVIFQIIMIKKEHKNGHRYKFKSFCMGIHFLHIYNPCTYLYWY